MQLSLFGITLTLLCLSTSAGALAPHEIFARLGPSVVALESIDEKGQLLETQSGTLIDAERLVARCNAIEMATRLRVSTKSGDLDAKVVARDRERNLCLIQAPGLNALPIPQATEPPAAGSRIFALSNALGLGVGISEGVVAGIRQFPAGNYIQFSAPISPGSEGGALVDEQGRLVGVIDYPNHLPLFISLTRSYLANGQLTQAWTTLAQVPADSADDAAVWYWKGVTLSRLGATEEAIKAYQKSLDRKLPASDWAWAGIGFELAAERRFPEAIAAFRRAEKLAPDVDEWRYQLVVHLKDGGRAGEALTIVTELVKKQPDEAKNWRQHGFVLAVLGRTAESIPSMEKSLQIDPRQTKVWGALIETYQKEGRREDAVRAYNQLRSLDGKMAEETYRSSILPYEERL